LCQPRIRSLIVTTGRGAASGAAPLRCPPAGFTGSATPAHRPALRLVAGTRLPPRVPVTPAQTKRARQA
jgi:hypothetical protein